jgi:hypothetical protein
MFALLLFIMLLGCILFLLNARIVKATGIKDALFYVKCDGEAWIAETAWVNDSTHEVHRIITTSNWQDGVVSVLDNNETIYHTKQPFTDRQNLQRFHRSATHKFFNQIKLRALVQVKKVMVFR